MIRVLIVEKDPITQSKLRNPVRTLLSKLNDRKDVDVWFYAASGREALEIVKVEPIEYLITPIPPDIYGLHKIHYGSNGQAKKERSYPDWPPKLSDIPASQIFVGEITDTEVTIFQLKDLREENLEHFLKALDDAVVHNHTQHHGHFQVVLLNPTPTGLSFFRQQIAMWKLSSQKAKGAIAHRLQDRIKSGLSG